VPRPYCFAVRCHPVATSFQCLVMSGNSPDRCRLG
jgi:hypothetical protein